MDILLLIINDFNLRQLYHELLLSKNIEVIPTATIENAVLMLTLLPVTRMVIYFDETNMKEVNAFFVLREQFNKWQNIHVTLLIIDKDFTHPNLTTTDTIIPIDDLTPEQVCDTVKSSILH